MSLRTYKGILTAYVFLSALPTDVTAAHLSPESETADSFPAASSALVELPSLDIAAEAGAYIEPYHERAAGLAAAMSSLFGDDTPDHDPVTLCIDAIEGDLNSDCDDFGPGDLEEMLFAIRFPDTYDEIYFGRLLQVADLNGDNTVDFEDLRQFVPEPASWLLAALGAVGLRRRPRYGDRS